MLTCLSAGAFASDNIVDIEAIKAGMKYEVYGKIALQAHVRDYENSPNLEGFQTNNESRIGFRGSKQFAKFKPLFIWQIESGYVDPSYKNHEASGGLGERDTFVGFEDWDSFGQIRLGRVLTPMYEIVDWPGANPGMGDVWDWGDSLVVRNSKIARPIQSVGIHLSGVVYRLTSVMVEPKLQRLAMIKAGGRAVQRIIKLGRF